jgi:hypothetical protein
MTCAWHRLYDLCLTPSVWVVADTVCMTCVWHSLYDLCLTVCMTCAWQTVWPVPDTDCMTCAWHRLYELCLTQNVWPVPDTDCMSCAWHRLYDLCLTVCMTCAWHSLYELCLTPSVWPVPDSLYDLCLTPSVWPVPDTVLYLSNLAHVVLKLKSKVIHLVWKDSPLDTDLQTRRKSRVSWIFKSLCLGGMLIYLHRGHGLLSRWVSLEANWTEPLFRGTILSHSRTVTGFFFHTRVYKTALYRRLWLRVNLFSGQRGRS